MEEAEGEGLKLLEESLKNDLLELRNQIEEMDLVRGVPSKGMSSIHIPKDAEYFRRERKLILQRTLQVCEAKPIRLQAEVMKNELSISEIREHTQKTIPLLLHQHFLDRMHELVIAKHSHQLRWKRYCDEVSVIESIYPEYKARVQSIMDEYIDYSSRAHRLGTAREGFLQGTEQGIDEVTNEDIFIFMRWLIVQMQSLKLFNQFARIIQWFPYIHYKNTEVSSKRKKNTSDDDNDSDFNDDTGAEAKLSIMDKPVTRLFNANTSDKPLNGGIYQEATPHPPSMVAGAITSHNPLTPTQFNIGLAAAGGGIATDETTRGLPLHTGELEELKPHLIVLCHAYNITMDVSQISSSTDEMELYSCINRKYRALFSHQEQMRNFKTYDIKDKNDKWGLESGSQSLLKPCNWLDYVKFKPKVDADLTRQMTQLRAENNVDELLRAASHFIKIGDVEKVQDALRHHALLVQHPPVIHTAAVVTNKQGLSTAEVFKKIYTNPELYSTSDGDDKSRKRRNSYDFQQTLQMLGLEDQDKTKDDPSSVQGAYLSYLHLRHLKLRDMQRTCLSVFNYFRSIERTLTIMDQGLSLGHSGLSERSNQNHRTGSEFEGLQGGSGNLGGHGYLFHSPREFRISETEFLQFLEVENHDDFYYHEDGRIHVRDQNGFFIVYDIAQQDLDNLEHDIHLIATFFLEKDSHLRTESKFKRKRSRNDDANQGDFDIAQFAHREVDRFGLLYDMWTNEAAFQECKKALMDCYMEVYQHTFSPIERRRLSQVMVDLMYLRPRIDFEKEYFIYSYRFECAILRLKTELTKRYLNAQIMEQREFLRKIQADGFEAYGMPLQLIEKCPIAVNADVNAVHNPYLLEFHPSLSSVANLPELLNYAYDQLHNIHQPTNTTNEVMLEKSMMEIILMEWQCMEPIGNSYAPNVKRDLFNSNYCEDPVLMSDLATQIAKNLEAKNTRGDKRTRKNNIVGGLGRILDLIVLRQRLIDAAWESKVLARIYREKAEEMGYEEFHLFLRYIQFEASKKKEGAETAKPPLFITSIQDDDTAVDKFAPSSLPLAIHEIDESHVGKFSFKNMESIKSMVEGTGVENLSVILKLQVAHKNAIAVGVLLANNCRPDIQCKTTSSGLNILEPKTAPDNSAGTTTQPGQDKTGPTKGNETTVSHVKNSPRSDTPAVNKSDFELMNKPPAADPESFFSIQLEKTPSRDRMMNVFINKTSNSHILKNPNETERLKRDLLSKYCDDFNERIKQASLRAQIIAYYNNINLVLRKVPSIAETFFKFGQPDDKKTDADDMTTTETDPRTLRPRPNRVLSADGNRFLNIWFIPHYKEILYVFKEMDDELCSNALKKMALIVGAFHDILHYLVAHARLGTCKARISSENKTQFVTTDWGGNEGIDVHVDLPVVEETSNADAAVNNNATSVYQPAEYDGGVISHMCTELREIQKQIDSLFNPMDPELVAEMLSLRRDAMFLEFDVCVRHILRETFLASNNQQSYDAVTNNTYHALVELSNAQRTSITSMQFRVPEPMEPRDTRAVEMFPWRTFINLNGPFPIMYDTWFRIEYNLQMCLAGLRSVDKPVVHGELLALNLCLEDVLAQNVGREIHAGSRLSISDADQILLLGKRYQERPKKPQSRPVSRSEDAPSDKPSESDHISTTRNPTEAYKIICQFLIIWKRVDHLKYEWAKKKMNLESIDNPIKYRNFCKLYKTEKLYPLMKSLAVQYGQYQSYEIGPIADTDMHITPKGVPEVVVKQRQLLKLIETFETIMLNDVRKRILRQIDIVIKERNREEGNLPVDLWKKPAMKEVLSVKRPTIAEDFIQELMSECNESEDTQTISFKTEHINKCLQNLAINVMAQQREVYENYAMYYENLLKHQHQLIYEKDREIKDLKEQLKARELSTVVDVQFQLSDQAHSLLLEVTALRAKVAEMKRNAENQDKETERRLKEEYNKTVQNLFSVSFQQKNVIDEYREHLHEATLKRIQEVRTEAAVEMGKVKEKSGARATAEDELNARNLALSKQNNEFRQRNIHLRQMMIRMRSLFNWRETYTKCDSQKKLFAVEGQRDSYQMRHVKLGMQSEQSAILLKEELASLKEYLTTTEKDLNDLRRKLEKELKEKMEKKHAAERKAASDKQLAMVKQMHIDELLTEMQEKNGQISTMGKQIEQHEKSKKSVVDKSFKELDTLKKSLREERRMKQSAFGKVDDLLSQLYEYETAFSINRVTTMPSRASGRQERGGSSSISNVGRPDTGHPAMGRMPIKSLTPELKLERSGSGQRPKTFDDLMNQYKFPYTPQHILEYRRDRVGGAELRSRIAEQLLHSIEPDTHEKLVQLGQARPSTQSSRPSNIR